jgi:hypothetical protein
MQEYLFRLRAGCLYMRDYSHSLIGGIEPAGTSILFTGLSSQEALAFQRGHRTHDIAGVQENVLSSESCKIPGFRKF